MAGATSILQAVVSSANNTRSQEQSAERTCSFSGPKETAHLVAFDRTAQKQDCRPGRKLDIMSAKASTWADEELAKRKSEVDTGEAPTIGYLDSSKNIIEGQEIAAGRERGDKTVQFFDDAWASARTKT